MMLIADEFSVPRSDSQWSRFIADNAVAYLDNREKRLVAYARAFNAALSKCTFLGVDSPESKEVWAARNVFWKEFESYLQRK